MDRRDAKDMRPHRVNARRPKNEGLCLFRLQTEPSEAFGSAVPLALDNLHV